MLISSTDIVDTRDLERYAWTGIHQFTNKSVALSKIKQLHGLDDKQLKNAQKQAEQIRYTILLSEEHYRNAKNSTLLTKPLLLYYSIMCLAQAEILLKQDGDSSLDRARGKHKHHGLDFVTTLQKTQDFADAASSLSAKPVPDREGDFRGTFELWRRSARHLPMVGKSVTFHKENASTSGHQILLHSPDEPLKPIDNTGVSLFDCIRRIPALIRILVTNGCECPFVRSKLSLEIPAETAQPSVLELIVHPTSKNLQEALYSKFQLHPSYVNILDIKELVSGGFILRQQAPPMFTDQFGKPYRDHFDWPNGYNLTSADVYLATESLRLNEFGNLYIALFILSNLARYYPDVWVWHVENNTSLALVMDQFLEIACERMAVCALSELQQTIVIQK